MGLMTTCFFSKSPVIIFTLTTPHVTLHVECTSFFSYQCRACWHAFLIILLSMEGLLSACVSLSSCYRCRACWVHEVPSLSVINRELAECMSFFNFLLWMQGFLSPEYQPQVSLNLDYAHRHDLNVGNLPSWALPSKPLLVIQ